METQVVKEPLKLINKVFDYHLNQLGNTVKFTLLSDNNTNLHTAFSCKDYFQDIWYLLKYGYTGDKYGLPLSDEFKESLIANKEGMKMLITSCHKDIIFKKDNIGNIENNITLLFDSTIAPKYGIDFKIINNVEIIDEKNIVIFFNLTILRFFFGFDITDISKYFLFLRVSINNINVKLKSIKDLTSKIGITDFTTVKDYYFLCEIQKLTGFHFFRSPTLRPDWDFIHDRTGITATCIEPNRNIINLFKSGKILFTKIHKLYEKTYKN